MCLKHFFLFLDVSLLRCGGLHNKKKKTCPIKMSPVPSSNRIVFPATNFYGEISEQKTQRHCHFRPIHMALSKKWKIVSIGKDVEKTEYLCTVGGNVI